MPVDHYLFVVPRKKKSRRGGALWGRLGNALGTLWGRSGNALGCFRTLWGHFADALGCCGMRGDALGTLWKHCRDALGRFGDALGHLGMFWHDDGGGDDDDDRLSFLYIQTPDQPPTRPLC